MNAYQMKETYISHTQFTKNNTSTLDLKICYHLYSKFFVMNSINDNGIVILHDHNSY